ncbi:hypothetical protein KIL84_009231 [Mauremys mutica]|uniref:Uncharacterized protein n=1 Tax=Mauremys mutica TaxID=74926 RepID=A0A9D3XJX2_9SAUR|nr:hypothetical protein KIL84_009231 [Mauremys mutica]
MTGVSPTASQISVLCCQPCSLWVQGRMTVQLETKARLEIHRERQLWSALLQSPELKQPGGGREDRLGNAATSWLLCQAHWGKGQGERRKTVNGGSLLGKHLPA